mmetsp:Transcript_859/g.1922  ORF Transcript_859/g.1922 Transcript_859/m.1922 type:complete len:235 (+) Transcript_859:104-808(+)
MPCVLWGVACFSLPGHATVGEVINEFRETLSLQKSTRSKDGSLSARSWSNGEACKNPPRVDLYKLVPIADHTDCRLTPEEHVVVHLPDSSFGCAEIEDLHRERDEAELRYERVREAFVSLSESIDTTRAAMGGEVEVSNANRKEEAAMIRQYAQESEQNLRELQETTDLLRQEFMLLRPELLPGETNSLHVSQSVAPGAQVRAPIVAHGVEENNQPYGGSGSHATLPQAPRIRR